jgi:hypothetical protein
VAKNVSQARALHDIVKAQGRDGAVGIVQGERALARLEHGHEDNGRVRFEDGEVSFPLPFIPGEEPESMPAGGDEGMGSRTQADVTPGAEPTRKSGAES